MLRRKKFLRGVALLILTFFTFSMMCAAGSSTCSNGLDSTEITRDVIGKDSRINVATSDLKKMPYSAICALLIKDTNGNEYGGTGFLVKENNSSKLLLTAAHNVQISGKTIASVKVYPGGMDSGLESANMIAKYVPPEYSSGKYDYDWAIVKLDKDLSSSCGAFAMRQGIIANEQVAIAGFGKNTPKGRMARDEGPISSAQISKDSNQFGYKIDTSAGDSGAPVIKYYMGQYVAIGVHNNSGNANFFGGENRGVSFYPAFYNKVNSYS